MNSVKDQVAPVIKGFIALLLVDTGLLTIFGGTPHIRERRSVQAIQTIPGIYWSIIDQLPGEHLWSALVQWDVWAESYAQAVAISDRIAVVMHRTSPHVVGGVFLWSHLESVEEAPEPGGGAARRINIYRYRPVKAATTGA